MKRFIGSLEKKRKRLFGLIQFFCYKICNQVKLGPLTCLTYPQNRLFDNGLSEEQTRGLIKIRKLLPRQVCAAGQKDDLANSRASDCLQHGEARRDC